MQSAETIEAMRIAGRIAADALVEIGRNVRPGVSTDELTESATSSSSTMARPSTLGYRGYPKSLCSSLNEVICHGIPDSTELVDGDMRSIDITAFMEASTATRTRLSSREVSARRRACSSSAHTKRPCALSERSGRDAR